MLAIHLPLQKAQHVKNFWKILEHAQEPLECSAPAAFTQ